MELVRRVAAFAFLSMIAACGPSFQAIYEGNARFEHCYALEETSATARDRADCWRDWSERYTYGQTRDRIQYAIARYVALSQASNMPTDEAMMLAAPGVTPRVTTITAPAPTNPFAPPPKVLDDVDGSAGRPSRASDVSGPIVIGDAGASAAPTATALTSPSTATPRPPSSECSDKCTSGFDGCAQRDGGACDKSYRACMRGCFK
jgi:hypothetical protein